MVCSSEGCGARASVTIATRESVRGACASCAMTADASERVEVSHPSSRAAVKSHLLVTMVRVQLVGAHEEVTVWTRGANSGHLLVRAGDGMPLAVRLLIGIAV